MSNTETKKIGSIGRPVYAHVYGDMSRAEAPIWIHYVDTDQDAPTPYQTADARHNPREAVRLAKAYAERG